MNQGQSTIRATFDADTDKFLRQLSHTIAGNVNQFEAKENPQGGNTGFQVPLVELNPGVTMQYVMSIVNEVSLRTPRLAGKVVPLCQVCDNGDVRIKIDCPEMVLLGAQLTRPEYLQYSTQWASISNDVLYVSIGIFHGIHRVDLETWLNNELCNEKNVALFPNFNVVGLTFSDGWQYGAPTSSQIVALRGGAKEASSAAGAATASAASAKMPAASADGLDDLGLAPADAEGWLNDFASMANVADDEEGALRTAAAEESHGAGDEARTKVDESGPYQSTIPPAGGSVWGMNSSGKIAAPKQIVAMRDAAKGAVTVAKPALVAAVKRPVATTTAASAATSAAAKSAQQPSIPKAQDRSKEDGSTKPTAAGEDPLRRPASARSGPNWMCPACKCIVYGAKPHCPKCRALKPAGGTAAPAAAAAGSSAVGGGSPRGASGATSAAGSGAAAAAGGSSHLYPRKPKDGDVRDGDWICSGCKGHNFASKIACFTCRSPRPPGYIIDAPDASSGETKADRKPGDWTCPKCNENVFAKRNRCYKCSTSKPKSASGEGSSHAA